MEGHVYTTHELVEDIIRGVITAIILLGGGYAIISGNQHAIEVTALMGVCVGYYFNPSARTRNNQPAPNGNGGSTK